MKYNYNYDYSHTLNTLEKDVLNDGIQEHIDLLIDDGIDTKDGIIEDILDTRLIYNEDILNIFKGLFWDGLIDLNDEMIPQNEVYEKLYEVLYDVIEE